MTDLSASAPGKLFLSGEYAVLAGAPAVVAAVDRRAVAREVSSAPRPSPVIDAVRREIETRFGSGDGERALRPIAATTSGFSRGRHKLGLGSSAAVAAAACAVAMARLTGERRVDPERLLEVALAAHRAAQGGRGSGADVAAAVLGGTIVFSTGAAPRPIPALAVSLAFVWTGRSASTARLIDGIEAFRAAAPEEHGAILADLRDLAAALAAAHEAGDAYEIVRLTGAYGAAMERLGRASGAPIVTSAHARVRALAAACGGAGKPSGAGGGDLAMAVFADDEARARFALSAADEGLPVIDLRCGEGGAALEA